MPSYDLMLGYPAEEVRAHSSVMWLNPDCFEVALVTPFSGGVTVPTDPDAGKVNSALNIAHYEYGEDPNQEVTEFCLVRAVNNDGLVRAEISIPTSYSQKVWEIADVHLSNLHGIKAAESIGTIATLISGLGDETDFENFMRPVDGNIKHVANTLVGWIFQHPDAYFCSEQ